MTIAVIGAGAFGTALACALADAGHEVLLWSRSAQQAKTSAKTRNNPRLPDITLPKGISPIGNLATTANANILLLAVPAQKTAKFLAKHVKQLPKVPLVLCAKGIDLQTFQLQTDIAAEHAPDHPVAVLTGPGFASEIAQGLPTALTLVCTDPQLGESFKDNFPRIACASICRPIQPVPSLADPLKTLSPSEQASLSAQALAKAPARPDDKRICRNASSRHGHGGIGRNLYRTIRPR